MQWAFHQWQAKLISAFFKKTGHFAFSLVRDEVRGPRKAALVRPGDAPNFSPLYYRGGCHCMEIRFAIRGFEKYKGVGIEITKTDSEMVHNDFIPSGCKIKQENNDEVAVHFVGNSRKLVGERGFSLPLVGIIDKKCFVPLSDSFLGYDCVGVPVELD